MRVSWDSSGPPGAVHSTLTSLHVEWISQRQVDCGLLCVEVMMHARCALITADPGDHCSMHPDVHYWVGWWCTENRRIPYYHSPTTGSTQVVSGDPSLGNRHSANNSPAQRRHISTTSFMHTYCLWAKEQCMQRPVHTAPPN